MDGLRFGVAISIFVWLVMYEPVSSLIGHCPKGWLKHGRKCYVMIGPAFGRHTFHTANQVCRDRGGELMNTKTKELVNMATVLLRSHVGNAAYLGLNDRHEEGDFRWGDGSKDLGLFWKEGQPSNLKGKEDCVQMRKSGKFNDIDCDKMFEGVVGCEKTAKEQIVVPPKKGKSCKGMKKPVTEL